MKELRSLRYAKKVSRLIQVDTVRRPGKDEAEFARLHALMEEMFPLVYKNCELWSFENSLLFFWKGKSEKSLLLMSHQDVVEAPGNWKYPPFSGTIAEGKLWGRGAYDLKGNLHSILCAMEELMEEGYVPYWNIYLASSHEEETGGNDYIVDFMKEKGVRPEFILDEGGTVQPCQIPLVDRHFISVGVAEKGYMDLKCIARGRGGHSNAPSKEAPLNRLAGFICEVTGKELFPVRMNPASREMYRRVSAYVTDPVYAGQLLDIAEEKEGWQDRISEKEYAKLHTTIAFTMASGSEAPNVIPQEASVTCNIRVAPGDKTSDILRILGEIAGRFQIEFELLYCNEASGITSPYGEAFRRVEKAARKVWEDCDVIPILLAGCTDTKHFLGLCTECLRFTALKVSAEQQAAVHGIDENIDIDTLPDGVDFFKNLIRGLEDAVDAEDKEDKS